ncbi:MAG: phosphoenolpyruvate carboxylase [bacterium]|nr:phosphoenolpyruvate carboxylase [bacterium]
MSTKRKIPTTMVTQHPDHASTPYWHYRPFISTQDETEELFLSFSELDADEYKWDWEGKLVDESVLERLFSKYYEFFSKNQIGIDKFLTFRLPNPKVETEFRLGRAFMALLAASGLATELGLYNKPLFEVILPMTESADEMIAVQEAFREIASMKHPLLKIDAEDIEHVEMIPLFEDIETISHSDMIIDEYIGKHMALFGFKPEYIRPYVARSDPALNAGIVPTVLAIKIALSRYKKYEEKTGIQMYPMIGAASLPFRGGINPRSVAQFIDEYSGIRTTTLQSGFRYDYPKNEVFKAVQQIKDTIGLSETRMISSTTEKELRIIMKHFAQYYQMTIKDIAPLVNKVAGMLPKRRERVQHIGLFGYSRGVGDVKLPRAIGYTAALYSLGTPPELIGTGRGLKWAKKHSTLDLLESTYINLRSDLLHTVSYTNKELLETLAKDNKGFAMMLEDYYEIVKYLESKGVDVSKITEDMKEHQILSDIIYSHILTDKDATKHIEKAARLRKSMG